MGRARWAAALLVSTGEPRLWDHRSGSVLATAARLEPGALVGRQGRGGGDQGEGEARRVKEEFQLLNPFCFDFPQVTQLPGFRQML